ncbi:serine hydrolase domain-containing protein [Streptomonospora nanhaiensis]|uniref:CubicO group peptidase (Beta-lactamase class C family) n=1 Tax=Streptomonospora nanhaiensis TaxID=1323731 RepID=A0A853BTT4_9ACTN|nr:serine hydrolase domain-containing protein [Streptomonospora nanhaiensis]MBX9389729.1 beta-lactamase family protein [Streptomonospora nanhaiensis]NYI98400.1 CubicO group peptidase (beta-lactamase class C family) [Streptomonospora nanhaiensis]
MRASRPRHGRGTTEGRRRRTLPGAAAAGALTALALLGAFAGPGAPALADEAGAGAAELDRFAERYVERTGLPGAAVAVTRGQEVVLTAGYGHDSDGAPLRADTPMRIASLSKSFTALAVMQLVEAGRVDLDRPVRTYLPEFRLADPRGADITVRQLLDQSSGMSDRTFPEATRSQPDSLREAVARLRTAGLAADPGTDWNYHNPNYHVAARLVEVVSGRPFDAYLEQEVFAPAGMDDTTAAETTGAPVPGLADGHIRAYGAAVAVPEPDQFAAGSGGIVSTAEDMARWLLVQANGGRSDTGERLLSAEGVAETHTASANEGRSALGWMRRVPEAGDRARLPQVWHGGMLSTYSSYQFLVPETGYGVAVLFNSGMALTEEDTSGLAEGLLALAEGRTPPEGGSTLWRTDAVFGVLTALTAALGVRGVLRAGAWAARRVRRPRWRAAARLLPYLVPPGLLAVFQPLADTVMGGRDASWLTRFYAVPAELLFLGTAALACAAVVAVRVAALVRSGRGARSR